MTFNPQYSQWSIEDFNSASGAVYENPGEFEYVNGATRLLPTLMGSGDFSHNAPWDPINTWCVDNNLDSKTIVEQDFVIALSGSGIVKNIGSHYGQALETEMPYDTSYNGTGAYPTTNYACIVHEFDCGTETPTDNITIQLDVRSVPVSGSRQISFDDGTIGLSYPGIYIGRGTDFAFIECHPSGLSVFGVSGATIPIDLSSSMHTIRIAASGDDTLTIATDNNDVLSVPNAFINYGGPVTDKYLAFGAIPLVTGQTYSGSASTGTFHDITDTLYDASGHSGVAGFVGRTLWDNIKITYLESTIKYPLGHFGVYPSGTKTLYTSEWHPNQSASQYLGAYVEYIPTSGGVTTVTPQYYSPSGNYGSGEFVDAGTTLVLSGLITEDGKDYIDLTDIPVFPQPFDNRLRFKITSSGENGVATPIDTITVFAKTPATDATFSPNWKMNALPQQIYVTTNKEEFLNRAPQPHFEDIVFLHNENGDPIIRVGQLIGGFIPSAPDGRCLSGPVVSTTLGFAKVDGIFGDAWGNYNILDQFSGVWNTSSSHKVAASGIFVGNMLDTMTIYPDDGSLSTFSGKTTVLLDVQEYEGMYGSSEYAQVVTVDSFITTDTTKIIGVAFTGAKPPLSSDPYMVTVEGVIQIPNGPGVRVEIHENATTKFYYYLNGEHYRTPRPFSVSAPFSGNHSAPGSTDGAYISFSVLPRPLYPDDPDKEVWGDFAEDLIKHKVDKFVIYNLTGYVTDHCYLQYTGASGNYSRAPVPLDDTIPVYNTSGTFSDLEAIAPYEPVERDSLIIEGWIRPIGFASGDQTVTKVPIVDAYLSDSTQISTIYIDRDGMVSAEVAMGVHAPAIANTGDTITQIGPNASGTIATGITSPVTVGSNLNAIAWGDWNHIGLCIEEAALGDTYTGANQPAVPGYNQGFIHGARAARIHLLVNGKVVDSKDVSISPYDHVTHVGGSIAPGFPSSTTYELGYPPITRLFGKDATTLTIEYGKSMVCDFDHFRYGIRSFADAMSDIAIRGAKAGVPQFMPEDGAKPPVPIEGGIGHWMFSHIYRLDYDMPYVGWDTGYARCPALFKNRRISNELKAYAVKSSYEFLKRVDDGPKGRPAIRLGPGQSMEVPWSSYDERIFNGENTYNLETRTKLYDTTLTTWANNLLTFYDRTTSDSSPRMGCFVRLNKYPGSGVMDIMTFDQDGAASNYGLAQLYLGVDPSGNIVCGTRENFSDSNTYAVGPFTYSGQPLETGKWYHLGLDTDLGEGSSAYIRAYLDGELVIDKTLIMSSAGGGTSTRGTPLGYLGYLDPGQKKSVFRFGGDVPRDHTSYSWSYRHSDFDIAEAVVGFKVNTSVDTRDIDSWDWAVLASSGGSPVSGHADMAYLNAGIPISGVVGAGSTETGRFTYPPSIGDTGYQLLWVTANGGHDFEGPLFKGMALFGNGTFMNAPSYYAIYENDNAAEVVGTDDSPIQIASTVPDGAVNLALVSNKEWSSNIALSTFDLSDDNIYNITNKVHGDLSLDDLQQLNTLVLAPNSVTSKYVRLSSFPLWSPDSSTEHLGYYTHLVGEEKKGVYVQNATPHTEISGDVNKYFANVEKVKQAIKFTASDGRALTYDEFAYEVIVSPYNPKFYDNLSGYDLYGLSGSLLTEALNPDGVFTAIIVAEPQTINETVYVNYSSYNYANGFIDATDSETYKPIPAMKEIVQTHENGTNIAQSGEYTLKRGTELGAYHVIIWHGNISGFADNA
ncbi:MAG: hypothetical protein D6710_01865 [Nitrospirae bacterium]|nr:MAG: hypothetical protein D6710_01865 [Nitrospirota bacterium]